MILTLRAISLNQLQKKRTQQNWNHVFHFSCNTQLEIRFCIRVHLLKSIKALLFCTGRVTFTVAASQLTDTMLCACANAGPGIPHRSKRLGNNRCKLADGSLVLATKHKLGTGKRHELPGKSSWVHQCSKKLAKILIVKP